MKRIFYITITLIIFSGHLLRAQNQRVIPEAVQDSLDLLNKEIRMLKSQNKITALKLDSLLKSLTIKEDEKQAEDDLQKLIEEASQLAAREKEEEETLSKKFHSGVRQQQGLNPNISLGGDFFTAISSSKNEYITEPGEVGYGNNGFYMREVELALVAPLDPFTRGKTFISVTKEEISIEEAYMEWLNLPLNMNLKIGIFYAEFGPLNRYHDHALPQFDRPRALVNMFSNKGLGGTGVSSTFMLPRILFSDASSLDLAVVKGTSAVDTFSFSNEGLQYIGQFKNYYDLTRSSYLEFRFSGVTGQNHSASGNRSYVGSLGMTYKWTPVGREKYRTIDWRTEFLYSYRQEETDNITSKGFYTSLQNKLNARFWLGGRVGYSELPYDPGQYEWDFTVNIDFWQSEFVFTRIQYQYNQRNKFHNEIAPGTVLPDDHTILLQVNWAMGPHKHEAY